MKCYDLKLNETTNNEAKEIYTIILNYIVNRKDLCIVILVHSTRAKFIVRISSEVEFWQAFISVDIHVGSSNMVFTVLSVAKLK